MLRLHNLLKNKFVKHGIPFIFLVVGGSFALKSFTTLRYDFSKTEKLSGAEKAEVQKLFKKPSEYNIDTEYEKYKELDLNKWENTRIPRPWDENEQ